MSGALIAAAAITAGAGLYESSQSSGIANQSLGMAKTTFGEQQGFAQQLMQLVNNPSSVTSLPEYQFNFQQGADAVGREMAAGGFNNSGNMGVALTQYGQNYASSAYQQQVQTLAQLSGLTSASSPAQSMSVASNAQEQTFNQLSQVLASLGYSAAGGGGYSMGTPADFATLLTTPSGPTMSGPGGMTYNTPGWGG